MAWAHVQTATPNRVASGANAKAFASNVTTGALLRCNIVLETDTATITTVADNNSNTWTPIGSLEQDSGNCAAQMYYAKNANAGATTVTVTPSAGASHIVISEYSGIDTNTPFDVAVSVQGTGANADSGNVSTAGANELICGFCAGNRDPAVGSGFTERAADVFNVFLQVQDKNGDGGNENSTNTLSGGGETWIAFVAAFKELPGGGTPRRGLLTLGVG